MYISISINIYKQINVFMYIHIYTYMCTYICIYIYESMYIYTHMCLHTGHPSSKYTTQAHREPNAAPTSSLHR